MADRRLVVNRKGTYSQAELQANEAGSLIVALEDGTTISISPPKATDGYSVQAISEDATYKYFWFEDKDLNYYILRKHKVNKVFTYTKGTGGYSTVYVNSTSGPSGTPTWGSYGATF